MNFSQIKQYQFVQYLIYIIVWLVLSASGLWIFWLWRSAIFDLGVLLRLNPWAVSGIVRGATFFFGILWIVAIFTIEGYLRTGISKDKFWQRLQRVLTIAAIIAVVVHVAYGIVIYIA